MSEQQRRPVSALNVVMIVVGALLLLPGLCVLFFVAQTIATEDVVRLATRDPYFQIVLVVWAIGLAITLVGVLLIRYAMRRHRRQGLES